MGIEESWSLLDAIEKQAIARLSVFQGEFDRCAAQAITECDLALILSLLARSLLRCGFLGSNGETSASAPGRYEMLPEVRVFACRELAATPQVEQNVRQKHAEWYADISQRLYPDMRGNRQSRVYTFFPEIIRDVRAAWDWAMTQRDPGLLLKIQATLVRFHNTHGNFSLSRELLDPAISLMRENASLFSADLSSRLIDMYSETLIDMDRYTEAQPWVEQGLAMARQAGEAGQIASFLNHRARILWVQGKTGEAQENWSELRSLARQLEDRPAYLEAVNGLGKVCWSRGEHPAALELFQESLRVARELQADIYIGLAHDYLGIVHREMHDFETAHAHLVEGVSILREAGANIRLAYALNHLATVLGYLGEVDQEMITFEESLALARQTNERRLEAYTLSDMSDVLANSGELSKAFDLKQKAGVVFQEVGDLLGQVIALTGLAQIRLRIYEDRTKDPTMLEEAAKYIRQALEKAIPAGALLHFSSVLMVGIRVLFRSGLFVQAIQALEGLRNTLDGTEEGEEKSFAEEVEEEFKLLTKGLPDSVVDAARQMGAANSSIEGIAHLILKNL